MRFLTRTAACAILMISAAACVSAEIGQSSVSSPAEDESDRSAAPDPQDQDDLMC